MLQDPIRLRDLVSRYKTLKELNGYNPQERGTEFNKLISEMLECWGISSKYSVRGQGEIDVAFTLGGVRYVLEAKWERSKSDEGKIAKLQKRVQQRLITTLGVFVSISGYTPDAIKGANVGQRMELLLLDKGHIESMLSGLIPPEELFNLLVDKCSYEGGTYYAVEELFEKPSEPASIQFDVPESLRNKVKSTLPGVTVDFVIHDLPMQFSGMACTSTGKLVVTLPEGIIEVDPQTRNNRWLVPVPACYGHAVVCSDGQVLFRRQSGIGAWRGGRIVPLVGGVSGNGILFLNADGHPAGIDGGGFLPLDRSSGSTEGENAAILEIGESLGDSRRIPTTVRGTYLGDAVYFAPDTIAAIGGSSLEVIDASSGIAQRFPHNLTNTFSVEKHDDSHILIVANGQTVALMAINGKTVLPVAEIGFNGAISELCLSIDGSYYMYSVYADGDSLMRGAIVKLSLDVRELSRHLI